MVSIARKNLFQDKGRFLISIGGVAFAVLLIAILQALYQGWNEKITAYIDSVETDLWLTREGTQDIFHTPSILPEIYQDRIKQIDGVRSVSKLYILRSMVKMADEEKMVLLIGFDKESGIGGPTKIIEGVSAPSDSEIIIDKVLAKNKNLKIGDEIEIFNRKERIVGISTGGDMAFAQTVFVNMEEAKKMFGFENVVSYFLLRVDRDAEIVKKEIEDEIEDVDVLSVSEFSQNNKKFIADTFLPILAVLVVIGFIIGIVVIGLTIYTLTQEKTREYGILKAIGANNEKLYLIVFQQSMISGVVGFFIGVGLAFVVAFFVEQRVPEFVTIFRWIDFAWIFGSAILMGIVASYLPIKKIAGIDPAIVFKG